VPFLSADKDIDLLSRLATVVINPHYRSGEITVSRMHQGHEDRPELDVEAAKTDVSI
jgi:hypothetical protein